MVFFQFDREICWKSKMGLKLEKADNPWYRYRITQGCGTSPLKAVLHEEQLPWNCAILKVNDIL